MSEELFSELPPVKRKKGRPRGSGFRGSKAIRIQNVARKPGQPMDALAMEQMKRRIVDGLVHKTLDRILRENPDLPGRRMIARWMMEDPNFQREATIARQEHAQAYLEMCQDWLIEMKDEKQARVNDVRIRHVQWYLSKIIPQVYGDRLEIEHKIERVILPPNPQVELRLAKEQPTIAGLIESSTILPGTGAPVVEG